MELTDDAPIKIELEQLNIVATWNYTQTANSNNMCNICKHHIMASPLEKINKGLFDTKIVLGKCKHYFHSDCIVNLHKKTSTTSCPICLTPWNEECELNANRNFKQLQSNTVSNQIQPNTVSKQSNTVSK